MCNVHSTCKHILQRQHCNRQTTKPNMQPVLPVLSCPACLRSAPLTFGASLGHPVFLLVLQQRALLPIFRPFSTARMLRPELPLQWSYLTSF